MNPRRLDFYTHTDGYANLLAAITARRAWSRLVFTAKLRKTKLDHETARYLRAMMREHAKLAVCYAKEPKPANPFA